MVSSTRAEIRRNTTGYHLLITEKRAMLNSKDEIVQHLKEYFKTLGMGMELTGKKIIVRDNLFSASIIFHLVIAVLGMKFFFLQKDNLYLLPVVFLFAIIGYIIFWVDYQSINIIEFDLQNKNILVRNRSIVRRLVAAYFTPQQDKYYFEDCPAVEVTNKKTNGFFWARYFVNIKLRSGKAIELISFSDEINAILFSKFITVLIE